MGFLLNRLLVKNYFLTHSVNKNVDVGVMDEHGEGRQYFLKHERHDFHDFYLLSRKAMLNLDSLNWGRGVLVAAQVNHYPRYIPEHKDQ